MTSETTFISLNHASLLIKYRDECLLTDPWFQMPALGSWLPVPPLVIHPAYLTSIDRLSILVSHGHDDHCDDKFLTLFDKNTTCVTSDFSSPGTKNRISKLGFKNVLAAPESGLVISPYFTIFSFRNDAVSKDDALYVIKTPDAIIVHLNDCWFPFTQFTIDKISQLVKELPNKANAILLSQTNSASGHPLTYLNFSAEEKQKELRSKVERMILSGVRNAESVGIKKFGGYAGYSIPFVKEHPEYLNSSLFVDPEYLKVIIGADGPCQVIGLMPGEEYQMSGEGRKIVPFNTSRIKENSLKFYQQYGIYLECDSYNPLAIDDVESFKSEWILFLNMFNDFVVSRVQKQDYYSTILGKVLRFDVDDYGFSLSLKFGEGIVTGETFNKKIKTNSSMLNRVLKGDSLFENLYTGYIAEIERQPVGIYNKDIITYICMYSYFYKNNVLPRMNQDQRNEKI